MKYKIIFSINKIVKKMCPVVSSQFGKYASNMDGPTVSSNVDYEDPTLTKRKLESISRKCDFLNFEYARLRNKFGAIERS